MRILDFSDGFTSATDPGQGSSIGPVVTGSLASPTAITATITPAGARFELIFLEGSSGSVDASIAVGSVVGDRLLLWGADNDNTVDLNSGSGFEIDGPMVLEAGSKILLIWDGTQWSEFSRFG